ARRRAEKAVKFVVGHGQASAIIEIVHVEAEGAVRLEVEEMIEEEVDVLGLAVGSKAHHLVLARVHLEAEMIGQRGIEKPERMGEMQLLENLQMIAAAETGGRRGPLPQPLLGQNGWLAGTRGAKNAGGGGL